MVASQCHRILSLTRNSGDQLGKWNYLWPVRVLHLDQLAIFNSGRVDLALSRYDRQQFVLFPIGADADPVEGALGGIPEILIGRACPASDVLIEGRHLHQQPVAPVKAGNLGPGIRLQDLQGAVPQFPKCIRVRIGRADDIVATDTAPKLAKWLERNIPDGLAVFSRPEAPPTHAPPSEMLRIVCRAMIGRAIQQDLKRPTR